MCVFSSFITLYPHVLPFLILATWLSMIQKSEFIHYNYLGETDSFSTYLRGSVVNTDLLEEEIQRTSFMRCWLLNGAYVSRWQM